MKWTVRFFSMKEDSKAMHREAADNEAFYCSKKDSEPMNHCTVKKFYERRQEEYVFERKFTLL